MPGFKSHIRLSIAVLAAMLFAETTFAADHIDAPSILIDGRMDINDTYIFQSTDTADHTAMVMTVNPAAGILSPTTFNPSTAYEFDIDRDGDAIRDFTIAVRFSAFNRLTGTQNVSVLYKFNGNTVLAARGVTGQDIALRGGGRLRADLFEDPFFFDFLGFSQDPSMINFTGMDFFAGLNVSAIVIEYPRSRLGPDNISLNGRTTVNGQQMDRLGRPAINTALIPSAMKDAFNAGQPVNDPANFSDEVIAQITAFSGDPVYAAGLAAVLLPDVLTFDQSNAGGFLNGRQLADDVIDAELDLLTNGGLTTDMVDANDVPFLSTFPFLAAPN